MLKTSLLNRTAGTLARTYASLALRMDVHRQAPLPAGAKIIAANHPTSTDPFLMMGLTGEPIYILITNMCFQMPFLGGFLRRAGHIPVAAGNGRAAFEAAVALLKAGKTVGIFPEGALSPLESGACPAHTGVARLALAGNAPVIPAGIALQREHILFREARGGDQVETARLYFGGPYAVTLGQSLRFEGDIEDRPYVKGAAQQVMDRIMDLAQVSALRIRASVAAGEPAVLVPALGRL